MPEPTGAGADALPPIATTVTAAPPEPGRRHRLGLVRRHPMVVAFGLLILATLVMRLWWGQQIARDIEALQQGVRARGEALVVGDLPLPPPVPAEDDAVALYRQAASVDTGITPSASSILYPSYPPFGPAWDQAAAASEQANQTVFRIAREARSRRQGRFERTLLESDEAFPFASTNVYNNLRQVCNTVSDGAILKHLQGDDLEAVERLIDVQHLAEITKQGPYVLAELVGIGISAVNSDTIHIIAPGLRLDDPAVRARVRRLIAMLLDEEQARLQRLKPTLVIERLLEQKGLEKLSGDAWVIRPLSQRERLLGLQSHAAYAEALRFDNWPAVERSLADKKPVIPPPSAMLLALTPAKAEDDLPRSTDVFSYRSWSNRYFIQHFRGIAGMRLAAVSLAVQLYRHDHNGAWPGSLTNLVPNYLSSVPLDPFHDDGRPVGYVIIKGGLPDGGDRPMVSYDSGETAEGAIDTEPMTDWSDDVLERRPRVEVHQFRDLSRWAPNQRRFDQMMKEMEEEEKSLEEKTLPETDE